MMSPSRMFVAGVLSMSGLLGAGSAVAADLTPKMSPDAVAVEAFARMKAGQWTSAADAFDPEALARFRTLLAPLLDSAEQASERKDGDKGQDAMMVQILFAPAKSVQEVRALSDAEIFARVMSSTLSLAGANLERQQVLGTVMEGRDQAHVVVRSTARVDKAQVSRVEAITLHLTALGWRLALTGELEGLAESLQGDSGQRDLPADEHSGAPGGRSDAASATK